MKQEKLFSCLELDPPPPPPVAIEIIKADVRIPK